MLTTKTANTATNEIINGIYNIVGILAPPTVKADYSKPTTEPIITGLWGLDVWQDPEKKAIAEIMGKLKITEDEAKKVYDVWEYPDTCEQAYKHVKCEEKYQHWYNCLKNDFIKRGVSEDEAHEYAEEQAYLWSYAEMEL